MNLPSHFKAQRLARNLNPADLARMIGYRNIAKGANKVLRFERDGIVKEDLLIKIAEALGIDWATVEQLTDQDRRQHIEEWNRWANEPVPMRVVIRWMPAVYSERLLPEEITSAEAADEFACDLALQLRRQNCLVLNRRQSVWLNADGTVARRTEATPFGGPNEPWMQVKGRKFLLNLDPEI
jgi:transcriptional regulator with XRE-family HTH domain